MAKLKDQLAALEQMHRSALQLEWERVCKRPAPNVSVDLLRMGIAYHLQAKAGRYLPRASVLALNETGGQRPAIKLGTRLVRSWNGRTISVEVASDGFMFEDQRYGSLSAIANRVTGSKWSGPRFFGLCGQGADG